MTTREDAATCGEELSRGAEVPAALAALAHHVASNLELHAAWVERAARASPAANAEHEALADVAARYRVLGDTAERVAHAMRSARGLAAAPHDGLARPEGLEAAAQVAWLRKKIGLQRKLAELLVTHAEESETAACEIERALLAP